MVENFTHALQPCPQGLLVFHNGSIRKEDPGTKQPKTNSFMDRDWLTAFIPR